MQSLHLPHLKEVLYTKFLLYWHYGHVRVPSALARLLMVSIAVWRTPRISEDTTFSASGRRMPRAAKNAVVAATLVAATMSAAP